MSALISSNSPLDIYFLSLVVLVAILSGYSLWNQRRSWIQPAPVIFLFILIGGLVRWLPMDLNGIWFDEDFQFTSAALFGPVGSAVYQQQMPLDYLFSSLSYSLFGFQEFAPRFFPWLFGSLSCGFFYIWAGRFLKNNTVLLAAALFFAISPWLVRYSVEGRPISLTVFSGLIYLLASGDVWRKKAPIKKSDLLQLLLATFFVLGSTFFQNYIFVAATNLSLFLIYRPGRKHLIKLISPQILALLLWVPFLWVLLKYSVPKFSYPLETGALFNVSGRLLPIWNIFESTWSSHPLALAIMLPFAMICLFMVIKKRVPLQRGFLESLVLCVVFITLFSLLYFFLVKWLAHTRYSLMIAPAIVLFIFATLEQFLNLLENRWAKPTLTVLCTTLISVNAVNLYAYLGGDQKYIKSTEWRELYQSISSQAAPGDIILGAPFDDYDSWRMAGPFAHHFYLNSENNFHISGMSEQKFSSQPLFLRHLLANESTHEPSNVFLIHILNSEYFSQEVPEEFVFESFFEVGFLKKPRGNRPWPEVALELIRVSKGMKGDQKTLTLLQMEMEILIHLGQREAAKSLLSQLDSYNMKSQEPDFYRFYENFISTEQ